MKKIISITVILAVMIGAGIAEIILSSSMFTDLNKQLIELNTSIVDNKDNLDNEETLNKIKKINDDWNKRKNYVLMFSNHAIMRSLDEKLVSLQSWIECNGYEDSRALCETSIMLTEDLIDETYPIISNLF